MDIPSPGPGVKLFFKGALMAFAAGLAIATVAFYSDPGHYSIEHLKTFWPVGVAAGFATLGAYLMRSPIPQWIWERAGGVERRGKDQ